MYVPYDDLSRVPSVLILGNLKPLYFIGFELKFSKASDIRNILFNMRVKCYDIVSIFVHFILLYHFC